ncbi:putative uncharacterized protein (plasmid) [Caballeronia insecticola]|uniref:DUF2848 domain-containing protein n=2 Tax=Caballeronia insecticola TaxID=758793 RepID=R4WUP1_9BURK|nr:putative uncharacterized protein [Caballeronia insecticola]
MSTHRFSIQDGPEVFFKATRLVIASWCGRSAEEVERHIEELVAIGVRRPSRIPGFHELSPSLVTLNETIDVVGDHSSGEVEAVLLYDEDHGLLVGIGSDHTDRKTESYDLVVSKQMCAKPLGSSVWRYDEVAGHWDDIVARSWCIDEQGERMLYQQGELARLLSADEVLDQVSATRLVRPGTVIFCGTQPLLRAFTSSIRFEMELFDPILQRTLRHTYAVNALAHVE